MGGGECRIRWKGERAVWLHMFVLPEPLPSVPRSLVGSGRARTATWKRWKPKKDLGRRRLDAARMDAAGNQMP